MRLTKSQSAHLYQMMQRFIGFFCAMRHRMNVLHVDETDPFYVAVTNVINALQTAQIESQRCSEDRQR